MKKHMTRNMIHMLVLLPMSEFLAFVLLGVT